MSQLHSFQPNNLKLWLANTLGSMEIFRSLGLLRFGSNTRLLGLSSDLSKWNVERVAQKRADGKSPELSIEDVHALKIMIHTASDKAAIKCTEVFLDQMLFLVIGAIQVQSQTGSAKAWTLVNQSIKDFVNTQKEKRMISLGLVVTALIVSLSAMSLMNVKVHKHNNELQNTPFAVEEAVTDADPVTISTLLLAYNKMKSGTCQLPQAAMLPPEQRQAFLMFVNKGVIEVQHVENLRLALGYVNCLYPQELMHPVAPL